MNKTELITEIINLADKAERYDNLMVTQVKQASEACERKEESGLSEIDRIILKIGKQRVVDGALRYWKEVKVNTDEETGETTVQGYDKWLERAVQNIPDYISRKEFMIYFDNELREVYEEELEKALDRFEEEGK